MKRISPWRILLLTCEPPHRLQQRNWPRRSPSRTCSLQRWSNQRSLETFLLNSLEQKNSALGLIRNELMNLIPLRKVQMDRQRLDESQRRGSSAHAHRLQLLAARLAGIQEHLSPLNPQAVLAHGYALVLKDGRLVKSRSKSSAGGWLAHPPG